MILDSYCPPAILYLGFSITQILIDTFKGLYNTAFFQIYCYDRVCYNVKYFMFAGFRDNFMVYRFCSLHLNDVCYCNSTLCIWIKPKAGKTQLYN